MAKDVLVAAHPLNRTVDALLETLSRPELLERRVLIDASFQATLGRAEAFARQVKSTLNELTASELSIRLLDGVDSGLIHVNNEIDQFINNANTAHINNAASNLDAAIGAASQAFFKRPVKGSRVYAESISATQNAAAKAIERISTKSKSLEDAISQSEARVSEQIRANEESRERLNSSVISAQNATNKARQKLEELESKFAINQEQKISEFSAIFQNEMENKKGQADDIIKKIGELEEKARSLVKIVGNIGVTGNYQARAIEEGSAANFWRWATIALFACGVILVVVNIILNFTGRIDLELLLVRFAIAASVTLPAIYTAKESARHRSNADRAKQTELELASLGPFLQSLTIEQQQDITQSLASAYFGRKSDDHVVDLPVDVVKLIEAAGKFTPSKL